MKVDRRSLLLSPAAGLALLPASQDAAGRRKVPAISGPLNVSAFGAVLDGVTDDSVALQRAIDACLREQPARPLVIDGACRLERSVFIDRRVDSTRGVFRIIGNGRFGGFLAAGNFPLFDSRLAHPIAPLSEHVWFQNIRFEALPSASLAQVLSDKFLRIQFQDCEFEAIRALSSRKYAQEWQFSRCNAHRWPGVFFQSHGGYHVTSSGGKYQNGGGTVFDIKDPTLRDAGCVGCSFHQDIVESNTGSYLSAAIVQGLSVSGLYCESNYGPALDFETIAANLGISVVGCMFAPNAENKANPAFFDIRWGRIKAGHSGGNFTSGRLHLIGAGDRNGLTIAGDHAALQLLSVAG